MLQRLFCLVFFMPGILYSQDDATIDELFKVEYTTPLTIDLDTAQDHIVQPKEKKKKKKVFYGLKTKKGFNKRRFRGKMIVERFRCLKEFDTETLDPYLREIYYYNTKRRKIIKTTSFDPEKGYILHGPYIKTYDEQLIHKGMFYKGVKHGRWVKLNSYDILTDKKHFYKGWPKEARIAYYDVEKTKMKEMIPIHYGEKNGDYYAYHKNGELAVEGQYQFNQKVGMWKEYYPTARRRTKRIIKYPDKPFDEETEPYIMREYSISGELIYDHKKQQARK